MAPELPGWAGAGGKSKVITGPEKKNGTTRKQVIDKQLGWHTKTNGKTRDASLFFYCCYVVPFFLGGGSFDIFFAFYKVFLGGGC